MQDERAAMQRTSVLNVVSNSELLRRVQAYFLFTSQLLHSQILHGILVLEFSREAYHGKAYQDW